MRKQRAIQGALFLARQISQLPAANLSIDYDEEADVLYISLKRPPKATETVEANGGEVLLHYRGKELVGITVLDVSKC